MPAEAAAVASYRRDNGLAPGRGAAAPESGSLEVERRAARVSGEETHRGREPDAVAPQPLDVEGLGHVGARPSRRPADFHALARVGHERRVEVDALMAPGEKADRAAVARVLGKPGRRPGWRRQRQHPDGRSDPSEKVGESGGELAWVADRLDPLDASHRQGVPIGVGQPGGLIAGVEEAHVADQAGERGQIGEALCRQRTGWHIARRRGRGADGTEQQPSEEDGEGKSEFHGRSFQGRPADCTDARASPTTPETANPSAQASKRSSSITGRESLSPHRGRPSPPNPSAPSTWRSMNCE